MQFDKLTAEAFWGDLIIYGVELMDMMRFGHAVLGTICQNMKSMSMEVIYNNTVDACKTLMCTD